MENQNDRQNPANSTKGRPQQGIVLDQSESEMSQLAAVAGTLTSLVRVDMGCNLNQEEGQQYRDAQRQSSP